MRRELHLNRHDFKLSILGLCSGIVSHAQEVVQMRLGFDDVGYGCPAHCVQSGCCAGTAVQALPYVTIAFHLDRSVVRDYGNYGGANFPTTP